MTIVVSSSALATLTVSHPLLKKDVLLHLVVKLASPLQLSVIEKKKGHEVELKLHSGEILSERNAILRSLAGPALHYALDLNPFLLLGGHSITSKASPISAMALAGIASWQSVADSIKHKPETAMILMEQLNDYLATRAFLIPSCQCTLADMDMCLVMAHSLKKDTDTSGVPHFTRWMLQVHAVLEEYASKYDDVTIKPLECIQPSMIPMPVFFYGTEDFVPPASGTKKAAGGDNKQQETASNNKGGLTDEQKQAAAEKRAKKAEIKKQTKPQQAAPAGAELDISALDIRVGKITKAWHHEEADKLFCEEIDVGEDQPRQIASGLRPFYETSDLINRTVLVLCNLKARNLVGFPSHGMVLCASNADHSQVKFVEPPANSKIGERVVFDGIEMKDPEAENKVAKKKYFEKLAPDLKTNGDGVVVWKGHVANTSAGKVTAALSNAQVS